MDVILQLGSVLLGVVGALTMSWVGRDLHACAPSWAERIVRAASRRVPANVRARYIEEWLADLEERPAASSKLWHAIGCLVCAHKIVDTSGICAASSSAARVPQAPSQPEDCTPPPRGEGGLAGQLLRAQTRAIGKAKAAANYDPSMTDERLIELERQYWVQWAARDERAEVIRRAT